MENIAVVNFKVESQAFQAFSQLKQDPLNNSCKISQVLLVENKNGQYQVKDSFDTGISTGNDFVAGSLIGTCVGILGGPIGMLMGWGLGAATGSLIDASDAESELSLLGHVMKDITNDEVALLALVQETEPTMFDSKMQGFDATVTRYDAAEVAAEVREAQRLEQDMRKRARMELRQKKKDEIKGKIEEERAKIKSSFEKLK